MQKYIIAVGSPEISRDVQEALFRAGFRWCTDSTIVESTGSPLLVLAKGRLTHSSLSCARTNDIRNGYNLISSQEVIADPFQLDGATKPTVDMTMEDLEKHFGHPVKITKKK